MAGRCLKKRLKLCSHTVPSILILKEYSGGYTSTAQLPDSIRNTIDERLDVKGVLFIISVLNRESLKKSPDFHKLVETLKTLQDVLVSCVQPTLATEDSCDQHQLFANIFIEHSGVEVLLRLLMMSSVVSSITNREETDEMLILKNFCLDILSKLCIVNSFVCETLTQFHDLLNYLFALLLYKQTYIKACEVIEHILLRRKDILNLNSIPNLVNLIKCLDDSQLANFCRILSITISDLDMYENKSSLYAQNKQKRSKDFVPIRDINQELILNVPNVVFRLVKLACKKPYIPRFQGGIGEIDHWMHWIETKIAQDTNSGNSDDFENFIGGISMRSSPDSFIRQQSGLRIGFDLIFRVEVVYILGLLLVGKQRKRVQKQLAELQLIPELSDLFDQFIWRSNMGRSRNHLVGHNSSCECSPEVALKIQFLRLIHSFCDHSEYKHLMLSPVEYEELKQIQEKHEGTCSVDIMENVDKSLMCQGSKGLLSKIVDVMKKESNGSTFRFWLSRAIESYLRGTTFYMDQIFLIRRGLLQHVANNLISYETSQKEIRQSSFDLLGELIKFNIEAFQLFDKVLNTDEKFKKLISIGKKSLVDSNMFIRSLILSLEHFGSKESNKDYDHKQCRLLAYVADFNQQIKYLYKLLKLITVHSLTQENVSCLNTTLVFLMFANKKSKMDVYLEALYEKAESCTQTNILMENFRELLLFWQEHYLHKDKDCSALEKSSRINFEYWKSTVHLLVDEDRTSKLSLLHYIPEERYVRNN